jgi:hypothetical protein
MFTKKCCSRNGFHLAMLLMAVIGCKPPLKTSDSQEQALRSQQPSEQPSKDGNVGTLEGAGDTLIARAGDSAFPPEVNVLIGDRLCEVIGHNSFAISECKKDLRTKLKSMVFSKISIAICRDRNFTPNQQLSTDCFDEALRQLKILRNSRG